MALDPALADRILAAVEESFLASTGPGGQNVNKVASAVQLRVNLYDLRLDPDMFHRVKVVAGNRVTGKGDIVITARRYRTQEQNRTDARARLLALFEQASQPVAKRKKSRVNRVGKAARLKAKKARGMIKANRSRVDW
ncbi:MAG: alternative ribosome rescue aminoacyl-tRNA hydrolase ArfB [Sphingomonadaceae bacterium]